MENTGIEWAEHTFNPWMGCTRVSPACDHCYAAVWGKRFGVAWGAGEPRRLAKSWAAPRRWHRRAVAQERAERVFCASLADVFDAEVPDDWRGQLTTLINATPMLDWLLLTKRPDVMRRWWETHGNMAMLSHVACGVTIENVASLRARAPILAEGGRAAGSGVWSRCWSASRGRGWSLTPGPSTGSLSEASPGRMPGPWSGNGPASFATLPGPTASRFS